MTATPIIRKEVQEALERIIPELPHPVNRFELIGMLGAIADAYGVEGPDAEVLFGTMADSARQVTAVKHTQIAMWQMKGSNK